MADAPAREPRLARVAFVSVPEWILGTLMLVGVAINLANVVGRYLFGVAIHWAEEIMVFITIWGVFVGLITITWRGEHLNMDLFSGMLRGRARLALELLVAVVLIVCAGFFAMQSYKVVSLFVASGALTVSAGIPKAIPHAALLVGFTLAPIALAVRLALRWRASGGMGTSP